MDSLVQALLNEQKRYQQNNLWDQGGDKLSEYSAGIMRDQTIDPTDKLTASLLSGLAGGFAKGYAQKQNRDFAQELAQSLKGSAKAFYQDGDTEAFYNSPFQSVKDIAPVMDLEREQQIFKLRQQKELDKYQNDLLLDRQLGLRGITRQPDETGALKYSVDTDLRNALQMADGSYIPPEIQGIAAKAISGDSLAPQEYEALVRNNRLDLVREGRQARQIREVDDRFRDSFGMRQGQSAIGADLEYITDVVPTPSTATKEQQRQAALNRVTQVFNEVANNPNLDLMSIIGNDAAIQDALRQTAFQDMRDLAGTGAALTGNEQNLITDQLFSTLGTDPKGAIGKYITGKDQKQFARDFAGLLNKLEDARLLKTYGAKRTNRALSSYDPALLQAVRGRAQGNWANEIDSILSGASQQTQGTSRNMGSGAIPAGMMLIRNKKTGETKLVPRK